MRVLASILVIIQSVAFSFGQPPTLSDAKSKWEKGKFEEAEATLKSILESPQSLKQERDIYKMLYEVSHSDVMARNHLATAKNISLRSQSYNGTLFADVKGLLAEQAYQFNRDAFGYQFDSDVYNALYFALKQFNDPQARTYMDVYQTPGDIFIVNTLEDDGSFYTIHQSGSLMKWSGSSSDLTVTKHSSHWKNLTVKTVKVSRDGKSIIMAGRLGSKGFAEILDTRDLSRKDSITDLGATIVDVVNRGEHELFILDDYGTSLSLFNLETGENRKLTETSEKLSSIEVTNNGNILYGTSVNGTLYSYNLTDINLVETKVFETGSRLSSIKINPNDSLLAIGNADGVLYISTAGKWDVLSGHRAAIEEIEFSPNGMFVATASADRTIRVWNLTDLTKAPLVLKDNNNRITSLNFTKDNQRILAGTYNKAVKSWPIDIDAMGNRMCKYLSRNLTKEEWLRFIGPTIDYQMTCNDINKNETPR